MITGYRADDSYYDYAESFLNNGITVQQLAKAMKLGKLGEQIVLKSKFAFSRIVYEGFDVAEKEEFYVLRKARDDEANQFYFEMLEEESDGLYIQDIIRGGIKNDDSRIPRNVSQKSGVSLHFIQMCEQRNKDINKASADNIYRISKVLGCTMEDLIEK